VVYNELKKILKTTEQYKDKTDKELDDVIKGDGLRVYTTMDYQMQQKAEEQVSKIDDNKEILSNKRTAWASFNAKNSSLISASPKTGAVYAYVGSAGFDRNDGGKINGQVDMVTTPVPQGSSMKLANYMNTFIQKNAGPQSVLVNYYPLQIVPNYAPKNFSIGDTPTIAMSIRNALNGSMNIPATQSMLAGGIDNYANLVEKMGYNESEVKDVRTAGITATLGAARVSMWSHAQLMQVLANGGVRQDLYTIERVTDISGNTLYEKKPNAGIKVVDERYTYLIYSIIKDYTTLTYPIPNGIRNDGYDCAGKTGTYSMDDNAKGSSNHIVFWGFCPDLLTGMWAGHNDNSPLNNYAVGEQLGQTLWTKYMRQVLPKFPKNKFVRPAGIVEKTVCSDTGFLATNENPCNKVTGLFVDGHLPKIDDNHKKLRVTNCAGTVKLASPADELAGAAFDQTFTKYETLTGSDFIQKQIDEIAKTKFNSPPPPTETCTDTHTSDGSLYTKILSPSEGTSYNAGDTFDITANSVETSGSMKFYYDDIFITESFSAPFKGTFTIPQNTSAGSHVIKVIMTTPDGKSGVGLININVNNTVTLPPTSTNFNNVNVAISSPANGTVFSRGNIDITAAVTDPDNAVQTITFYGRRNTDPNYAVIGTATKVVGTNSYTIKWNLNSPASIGQYEVYANVVNGSLTKDSGHIAITVT
jgi:membrane peptidoglycan carboxypeptidase